MCGIVRKQLAVPDDSSVEGGTKFSQLGADSLDTVTGSLSGSPVSSGAPRLAPAHFFCGVSQVEVVMALEEEFGISVEEESAQSIVTVEDAADLIEKLVAKKSA